MSGRPNFLVIQSDQHNSRNLGGAGDGIVRTPALFGYRGVDERVHAGVRYSDLCAWLRRCGV